MLNFKIGCDPELFIVDGKGNFISGHDLVPGTKTEPFAVKNGAIQADGVAAEFNIDPVDTLDDFLVNIHSVRTQMLDVVRQKFKDANFIEAPVARFDAKYFDSLPKKALELGCEPDYDAYTGNMNPKPETHEPMRTGSGHIHFSWGDKTKYPNDTEWFSKVGDYVRDLDAILYPMSLTWDDNEERRKLYGARGAFRSKPYGGEYRTLSNAWLKNEKTISAVYNATKQVLIWKRQHGKNITRWLESKGVYFSPDEKVDLKSGKFANFEAHLDVFGFR